MKEPHLAKYIVLERDGLLVPILFPRTVRHQDMIPENARPISAGFYQIIDADTLLVGGESTTLHLHARIEDEPLIKQLLTA